MIIKLLRGLGVPPALCGAARGIVEAAVLAAIEAVIMAIGALDVPPEWGWLVPPIYAALRTLEGLADHIDPEK